MSRATQKGTAFETSIANYLNEHVDDRIERRAKHGVNDRGDIAGVRSAFGDRVVIECKNQKEMRLSLWLGEAAVEAGNDDAPVGVVIHKRRGRGDAGEQYVTMTVADLVTLLTGKRVGEKQ